MIQKIEYNLELFISFEKQKKVLQIIDSCNEQLQELLLIRNPELRYKHDHKAELAQFLKEILLGTPIERFGSWYLFDPEKILVHFLPEDLHLELRTARNKNLILKNEQDRFYNYKVGIAGLSIGSHAAFTIAMMGGAKTLKIADPDTLSGSNLNRVRYDFTQLGKKKVDLVSSGVSKINPYSNIIAFKEGINENEVENFLAGEQKLDVLIEEVDNLTLKFLLRFAAKKLRIPVVMATDNGDNVIIDVERYDIDGNLPIFNGLVGDLSFEEFKEIPKETLPLFVGNIVGIDLVVPRVFESLSEVGKTLYSWPQLGSAANMSGSVLAYIVRQLSLGKNILSGKYDINIERSLGL